MKTYEQFNCEKIYWCINLNQFEDCLKKINNICKIDLNYYKGIYNVIIKTNQNYCYLSIYQTGGGWNPLINDNKETSNHRYYGDQIYKDQEYKFGGYINCTEEEVKNYIENYEFM